MHNLNVTEINIHVIGMGGCGGNTITNMAAVCTHPNIRFSSINTDISALKQCKNHDVLLIGENTTGGFGAGADPLVAENAARQSEEALKALIADDHLIIIIAGLGGGTGSGATCVLLDLAKERGIDVMCFVTLPFNAEGIRRKEIAVQALNEVYLLTHVYLGLYYRIHATKTVAWIQIAQIKLLIPLSFLTNAVMAKLKPRPSIVTIIIFKSGSADIIRS